MISSALGKSPVIDKKSFIAESAAVTGEVTIKENVGVWYNASIRADIAPVEVGRNSNVQDCACLHVSFDYPVIVGENVTVGHGAILHGCKIGNNTLIGMGAIVLDGAVVGDNCIIAAGSVVTPGTEIPSGSLAMGSPCKVKREMTENDIENNKLNAEEYVKLALEKIKPLTIHDVVKNEEVHVLIKAADKHLEANGYTEHSYRHVGLTGKNAADMLISLGKPQREVELAEIAGYMHDIGNAVNRIDHAHSGAMIAYRILKEMGMPNEEAAEVMLAIANHDEGSGVPVSDISAALILADKSDVHRSRVRNKEQLVFDIHDRVNYAVVKSTIKIINEEKVAELSLQIDIDICPVMDYFEIFLTRMTMCRKAAEYLGLTFRLIINENRLL